MDVNCMQKADAQMVRVMPRQKEERKHEEADCTTKAKVQVTLNQINKLGLLDDTITTVLKKVKALPLTPVKSKKPIERGPPSSGLDHGYGHH